MRLSGQKGLAFKGTKGIKIFVRLFVTFIYRRRAGIALLAGYLMFSAGLAAQQTGSSSNTQPEEPKTGASQTGEPQAGAKQNGAATTNSQQVLPPGEPQSCSTQGQSQNPETFTNAPAQKAPSTRASTHMFGILPAYNVVNSMDAAPLTGREKLHLSLETIADPFSFASAAVKAGIYQNADVPAGYGEGALGYTKRFGAAFIDGTTTKLLSGYAFPVLLRQDPRYFRKGRGGFVRRLGYAVSRAFITRQDGGTPDLNWSRFLGVTGSAMITNTYYPSRGRGVEVTMGNIGYAMANDAVTNILREFWPEVQRGLHRRHSLPN